MNFEKSVLYVYFSEIYCVFYQSMIQYIGYYDIEGTHIEQEMEFTI